MRYYLSGETLVIRGRFRAASTGIGGGIRDVPVLFNHSVPDGWIGEDPPRYVELVARREGVGEEFFGLLTAVPMRNLCIIQYDFITVFVTAGVRSAEGSTKSVPPAGTINIIVHSTQGMADAALLGAIITATEAKVGALQDKGISLTGTPTDAVIVAGEGEAVHQYAGPMTVPGTKIANAVRMGVAESLSRFQGMTRRTHPSLFVWSRFGGDHWVEWQPEGCPYHPCHFPGQACDFCYCPFYPCRDPSLGEWVDSTSGGRVWNCSTCTLLHEPAVAAFLRANPMASLPELKRVRGSARRSGA